MKKIFIIIMISVSIFANNNLITKTTNKPVQDVVESIKKIVANKGLTIFTQIDHSTNAAQYKIELKDMTLLIFGNPQAGTKLMQENPLIGLELPLKVLVYREGMITKIVYKDPLSYEADFGIIENKLIIENMSKSLDNLTNKVSR